MEEYEKQQRRDLKAEVIDWLSDEGEEIFKDAPFPDVDDRLCDYVGGIIADPDSHNLYELLALKRMAGFLKKYQFRPVETRKVILVLETLKFPGASGMAPIRLSPVQVYLLTNIYSFYDEEGRRVIQNAMLFVPRKFGKTTLIAGIAIYELIFGDADGQVYACANSYQQAKICFDNIRKSLKVLDPSGKRFKVNREAIYNGLKGRSSFAKCLASDATTLDGLNASCYIIDEYSQAKSADLRNVMATSTGTRENPLEIIITTASDLMDGPFAQTLESYKSILMEKSENDSVFALIFEPDVDDEEGDPATWKKVQPHLGVTVRSDYYARKWKTAQETAEDMLAFRTKLINVFAVNEQVAWITGDEVRDLFQDIPMQSLPDHPYTMCAFDLSVWDDMSAVCYGVYLPTSSRFHFYFDFYIPEETLYKHRNRNLYEIWRDQGYLTVMEGCKTIDYYRITNDILEKNKKLLIAGIGYDPYKSKDAVNMLMAAGAGKVLKGIKQTYGEFTGPVETMELMIKNKNCSFQPNPIIAWMFGNCKMDEDRMCNKKPIKRTANGKIDGAICALMCVSMFSNYKR